MATTITKIIDPNNGAGTDYTSLAAWEAAMQKDLVTADEISVAKCRCTGGTADTTTLAIDGWTTDATRYIKIWTDPTEGYRHAGEWDDTKYRLVVTGSDAVPQVITLSEENVRISGLQLKLIVGNTWNNEYSLKCSTNLAWDIKVDACLFFGDVSAGTGCRYRGIFLYQNASAVIAIQNCGFYLTGTNGSPYHIYHDDSGGGGSIYTYNCTFVNGTYGVYRTAATATFYLKNCGFSNVVTPTTGTFTTATNSTTTPTFASGKVFHLSSTDTAWKDQGTDLSADSGIINSLDIDGETRTGTWDIGADEYVAGATNLSIWASECVGSDGFLA